MLILAALLSAQAGLLLWPAWHDSPTYDEPGHLVAGLSYWKTGQFGIYRVNPPLSRLIGSIPVLFASPRLPHIDRMPGPGERPEFVLARAMMKANGASTVTHVALARTMLIPVALLGGIVCFCWARDLYGDRAGLLALLLWCASPTILAHGHLMTPDITSVSFATLASYCFSCWLNKPNLTNICWTGFGLGAALLSKSTSLFLIPIFVAAFLIYVIIEKEYKLSTTIRRIGQLAAIFSLAVWILHLGYGFEGAVQPLGEFSFPKSRASENTKNPLEDGVAGNWLSSLPIPVPYNFVQGIIDQKAGMDAERESYLGGQWKKGGWWYYYLYGLGIKIPLGFWCLVILAGLSTWLDGSKWKLSKEIMLILPPLVILLVVSSQTNMNKHIRYALPVLPYLFVWASKIATSSQLAFRRIAALACAWLVGSSLWIWPHSLSYFNESVGGPMRGGLFLVDSNFDWGQDLLYLASRLKSPSIGPKKPKLAYFGSADPRDFALKVELIVCPKQENEAWPPGAYALSDNLVQGMRIAFPEKIGFYRPANHYTFERFKREQPIAMAGYSIRIYEIVD